MIDFEYAVKRSYRRTICVSVLSDNSVVVKCPQRTKIGEVEKFLAQKDNWIHVHLRQNLKNIEYLSDVLNFKKILVKGEFVDFSVGNKNYYSENLVSVKTLKDLKSLLIKNIGGEFLKLFDRIRSSYSLSCEKVNFKDYKSRWGCCNRRGEITFNYKVLMLPEFLWEYVIVHELCHTVHMNHSAVFYKMVGRIMPDYSKALKELKTYACITRLY